MSDYQKQFTHLAGQLEDVMELLERGEVEPAKHQLMDMQVEAEEQLLKETDGEAFEIRLTGKTAAFCNELMKGKDIGRDQVIQLTLKAGFAMLMTLGDLVKAGQLDPAALRSMFRDTPQQASAGDGSCAAYPRGHQIEA